MTSKICGMGSAERSWGDVKALKNGQRSHLGGPATNKQATLYGSYCMEAARLKRSIVEIDSANTDWDDDDMNDSFDAATNKKKRAQRIIKCYMEEWEKVAVLDRTHKTGVISKTKILAKYGGLSLYDLDVTKSNGQYEKYLIDSGELFWEKPSRKNASENVRGGWALTAHSDEGNESTFAILDDEDGVLYGGLVAYYKTNPNLEVRWETRKKVPGAESDEYQKHMDKLRRDFLTQNDNGKRSGRCAVRGCKHTLALEGRGSHRCYSCKIPVHNLCAQEYKLCCDEDERNMYCSEECKAANKKISTACNYYDKM